MTLHIDLICNLVERGIINGLVRLDTGGPVKVVRPEMTQDFAGLRYLGGISGKGLTQSVAELTCCAEVIERFCASARFTKPSQVLSAAEAGPSALPLEQLLLYSEEQYRAVSDRASENCLLNSVPLPVDKDAPIEWTSVSSLHDDRDALAPTGTLFFDYIWPDNRRFAVASSNGLAAGLDTDMATMSALFELIERDAVAIWWYNRLSRPGVDRQLAQALTGIPVSPNTHIQDLTTDLNVPTYAAYSTASPDGIPRMGFGADLSARRALSSALLEHWQVCCLTPPQTAIARMWASIDIARDQPQLLPPHCIAPERPEPVSSASWQTLTEMLLACGLPSYRYVYQSQGFPLHVVRAIVPGLRPFWKRLAPGRLYDVPASMGWLSEPTRQANLNPIPIDL